MNWLTTPDRVFGWVWRNSLQAIPLIVLVFLVHKLSGRSLTAGMRYALSLLVLLGLLLPVIPRSPFSLGNLFPARPAAGNRPQVFWSDAASPSSVLATEGRTSSSRRPAHQGLSFARTGNLIWLAGLAGLGAIASWRYLKWRTLINRARPITDPGVLDLLEKSKLHMGVRRPVSLSAVDQLSSPAVFGVWHVRVLLPEAVLSQLNPAELRLVLLHELAHVRRNDILLNWMLMGVQFLHWFNPLVWLALHRVRSDCELMCDALVLKGMAGSDRVSYGHVLLKLTQGYSLGPPAFFGAVPVVSNRSDLKKRILMIRHYRQAGMAARLVTAALVVVLGCLTLTRARDHAPELKSGGPSAGVVTVSIDAQGNLRLEGGQAPVSLEDFKVALASRAATNSNLSLRIEADQHAPWAWVAKVVNIAGDYKITAISARIDRNTMQAAEEGTSTATPGEFTATNHGMVLAGGRVLTADRLTFDPATGTLQAVGHVRLRQTEQSLSAEHLNYNGSSVSAGTHQRVAGVMIKYVGPRLVSEEQIRATIHVRVGDNFRPEAMDDDVNDLYATGQFYNVRVATDSSPAGVNLIYTVQCSPRLMTIHFIGNSKFSDEDLLKRISSRIGGFFNERKLFADSQAIQSMYQEAGYPNAAIKYTYELDQPAAEAKATFAITEAQSLAVPVFQLRLVVDTPSPDSEPVTLITRHGNQFYTNVINVQKTVLLDQTALTSAKADTDGLGHPIIEVTLTEPGKERFAEVTRQNLGKRLAIFIGGTVCQAPVIRSEIAEGKAQISGDYTKTEAEDLARKISDAIAKR